MPMPQRPSGKIRPANGNGNVHLLYVGPFAAAGLLGMRESPSQSSMENRLLACAINWLEPGQGESDEPSANRMGAPEEAAEIGGRRTASQRPYLSTRASTRLAPVVPCTPHRSHQFESKSVLTHTFNFTLHSRNRISRCELRSKRRVAAATRASGADADFDLGQWEYRVSMNLVTNAVSR